MRVFVLAVLAFLSVAHAQVTSLELEPLRAEVAERTERLAAIEEELTSKAMSTEELLGLREELRALRTDAQTALVPIEQRIETLQSDLDRLGPIPAEGEPAESDALQEERALIGKRIGDLSALRAKIDLNIAASVRVGEAIAARRRDAFTGRLQQRGELLISPQLWTAAAGDFLGGARDAALAANSWRNDMRREGDLAHSLLYLGLAVAVALLLLIPLRRFTERQIFRRIEPLEPYPSRRVLVAALRTASKMVPGIVAGFFLIETLKYIGAVPEEAEEFAEALWLGFLALVFADAAVSAVFAPLRPEWRVAPLPRRSLIVVRLLAISAAAILVVNMVLAKGADLFAASPLLSYAQQGVVATALGALLYLLSRDGLWTGRLDEEEAASPALVEAEAPPGAPEAPAVAVETGEPVRRGFFGKLRTMGRILGGLSAGAALLGWVNLGYYVSTRAFLLVALFGAVMAVRALLRETVRVFDKGFTSTSEEEEEKLLYSWIGIFIDAVAVLVFIPPALLILGAEWSDVRGWIIDALIGFEVGNVRISFGKILSAIAIFVVLLWVTRQVQKTAESQIFPRSRIDPGVQNSLRTLIGYVGLVIAFMIGVGTLGFDLQNLAIIAGALSVGIGFGLQSIVNNFVSGLILLFERPIKVGDWIVTASGEGIVKRISVRSTEIETFDRSSVIVPNSELIAQAVTNWTHKDKMGRVLVRVGAAYDSDAEHVIRILQQVARENRDILNVPAPAVVFEDFGASSLDFSLRCYIHDVGNSLRVRTDLRVAIHKAFRKEGIEIPFPQQDVYVRELASSADVQAERSEASA
jgi:small-conductance mechanosensitive channel